MQRYGKKLAGANSFNELPLFFNKIGHLYFVSTYPVRGKSSIARQ